MVKRLWTRRLCLLAAAAALAAVSLAGRSEAALKVYDPLHTGGGPGQYNEGTDDAGPNLGGQNPVTSPDPTFYSGGWVQAGGDNQAVKNKPSLKYPDFPHGGRGQQEETSQFGCCTFGRNGRPFGDVFGLGQNGLGGGRDPETLYGSFLIDFGTSGTNPPWNPADPTGPGSNEGKHGFEMWNGDPSTDPDTKLAVALHYNFYTATYYNGGPPNPPNTDFAQLTLGVKGLGGDVYAAGHYQVVGSGYSREDLAATNNGTHLVVMKLEFNNAGGEDRVTVYLDPTDSIESNWTPAASVGVPAGELFITHHSAFSSFQFDGAGNNNGAIDEIRWGDTFADVTPFIPEPSSLTLLLLAGLGLPLRRR
jgi:hypothetical protein